MLRSIARRAVFASASAAGAATLALSLGAAITPASAATIATKDSAGYQVSGAQFRYLQETEYDRAIGQYASSMGAGLGHGITLISSKVTVSLGTSIYKGEAAADPWDAAFDVTNTADGSQVGGCDAGNAAGTGGVTCNTSVSGEPGAFAPGYITKSVYYNKANGVLSFDVYAGGNDFHGFVNVGTGLSFNVGQVTTTLADPASVTPPASQQLLGRFSAITVTNYKGHRYTLTGPWTTSSIKATAAGNVKIASASGLSKSGAAALSSRWSPLDRSGRAATIPPVVQRGAPGG